MNENNIGLVIWGCRGGLRVIYTNGVVDCDSPEIRDTQKDIRSFLYYKSVFKEIYALEFTTNYKVYTKYFSMYDAGYGAYVAFTLYIPHKKKVENVRILLDEMLSKYFVRNIDPISASHISGVYDDINIYNDIIRKTVVADDRTYRVIQSSKQNDLARLLVYNDVADVDKWFSNPYQQDFYESQEIMFISSELYNNSEAIQFSAENRPEVLDDKKIKAAPKLPMLRWKEGVELGYEVCNIRINGSPWNKNDYMVEENNACLSFELRKDNFHEPIEVNDEPVASLLKKGLLTKDVEQSEYSFATDVSFRAKEFEYCFTGNDNEFINDNVLEIKGTFGGFVKVTGSKYLFKGKEIASEWTYRLRICKASSPVIYSSEGKFRPNESNERIIRINEYRPDTYKIESKYRGNCRINLLVNGENVTIGNVKHGDDVEIYTPARIELPLGENGNYDVVLKNKVIAITPKFEEFTLCIPADYKDLFVNKLSLKKREGDKNELGKDNKLIVPYASFNTERYKLTIDGKEHGFVVKDSNIYPDIFIVKNNSGEKIYAQTFNEKYSLNNGLQILHDLQSDKSLWGFDEIKYSIADTKIQENFKVITIENKEGRNSAHSRVGTYSDRNITSQKECLLKIEGCKGFSFSIDEGELREIKSDDYEEDVKCNFKKVTLHVKKGDIKKDITFTWDDDNARKRALAKEHGINLVNNQERNIFCIANSGEIYPPEKNRTASQKKKKPIISRLLKQCKLISKKTLIGFVISAIILAVICAVFYMPAHELGFLAGERIPVAEVEIKSKDVAKVKSKIIGGEISEPYKGMFELKTDVLKNKQFLILAVNEEDIERIQSAESDGINVTFSFKEGGEKTVDIKDWFGELLKANNGQPKLSILYEEISEGKKQKKECELRKIESPAYQRYEDLKTMLKSETVPDDITKEFIDECCSAADEYNLVSSYNGSDVNIFYQLAWDNIPKKELSIVKHFYGKCKDGELKEIVKQKIEEINEAEKEAAYAAEQERLLQQKQQAWINEWLTQRAKLWGINCKLTTVQEVEQWWKNLDDDSEKKKYLKTAKYQEKNLNIEITLNVYITFFSECDMEKFEKIKEYKSSFSDEQFKCITKGFLHRFAIFDACVKEKRFPRCFRMPQMIGLMDDRFELTPGGKKVIDEYNKIKR